jgi:FkbM family methyltransferase
MNYLNDLKDNLRVYGLVSTLRLEAWHAVWILCKFVLRLRRVQRRVHDYRMWLSLWTGGISWTLFIYGAREEDHRQLLRTHLGPGDRVLDLGANIGYYALMEASLIGDRGLVHAVEPDPRNLGLLRDNIALNGFAERIPVHPVALSNRTDRRQLVLHRRSNLNVLLPAGERAAAGSQAEVVEVETVDIYDFVQTIGKVQLLRMDLEGHEVEILEGLGRVCRDRPDLAPVRIVFEVHPWLYDDGARDLRPRLRTLAGYGYAVRAVTTDDEDRASLREHGLQSAWTGVSDFHRRGIYYDVPLEDALRFICDLRAVRIVLLERTRES